MSPEAKAGRDWVTQSCPLKAKATAIEPTEVLSRPAASQNDDDTQLTASMYDAEDGRDWVSQVFPSQVRITAVEPAEMASEPIATQNDVVTHETVLMDDG